MCEIQLFIRQKITDDNKLKQKEIGQHNFITPLGFKFYSKQ